MRLYIQMIYSRLFNFKGMGKSKKVKKQKVSKKESSKNESAQNTVQEEKEFDFGGIPDRDLKKNLGCG